MEAVDVEVGKTYRWWEMMRVVIIGIRDPGFFAIEKDGSGEVLKVSAENLKPV